MEEQLRRVRRLAGGASRPTSRAATDCGVTGMRRRSPSVDAGFRPHPGDLDHFAVDQREDLLAGISAESKWALALKLNREVRSDLATQPTQRVKTLKVRRDRLKLERAQRVREEQQERERSVRFRDEDEDSDGDADDAGDAQQAGGRARRGKSMYGAELQDMAGAAAVAENGPSSDQGYIERWRISIDSKLGQSEREGEVGGGGGGGTVTSTKLDFSNYRLGDLGAHALLERLSAVEGIQLKELLMANCDLQGPVLGKPRPGGGKAGKAAQAAAQDDPESDSDCDDSGENSGGGGRRARGGGRGAQKGGGGARTRPVQQRVIACVR